MSHRKALISRLLPVLAISGCLLTGLPVATLAQGLPGLTIFSGVRRDDLLSFRMDDFGRLGAFDRYRLRIPAKKITTAVELFSIAYPDTYNGTFETDGVYLKINSKRVPLDQVNWDKENRVLEIYPTQPVPANSRVEIVVPVRNPTRIGTHYFNASIRSPGDLPILNYVGTWILTIGNGFGSGI
jgi:hypothetical protein